MRHKHLSRLALVAVSVWALAAQAEDPATAAPRFRISKFQVEGNTLLPADDVNQLVAPYTGESRDFGDVQRALESLQEAYRKRGFSSVEVLLPEQEVDSEDTITLKVVEKPIAKITIVNNEHHDNENIMRTVPSLHEGEIPNLTAVGKSLRVANENPSKQTTVLFKNSEFLEDAIDATVKVTDEKPSKFFVTVDNTGNAESGEGRIGFGYQNYNMFNQDHRLSAMFVTAPQFPQNWFAQNDVLVFGLGYTIPLYSLGDSVDLIAAYSDVNATTGLDLAGTGTTAIVSQGVVLGAHYNWNLKKIQDYTHSVNFGLDYRSIRPVDQDTVHVSAAVSSTPVSLGYSGQWQGQDQVFSFSVAKINNIPDLVSHGHSNNFNQSTMNVTSPYLAEDDFSRYTFAFDYWRPIGINWQFHFGGSGQLSADHLVPTESFLLGGWNSVRGWHESALTGDKGYRFTVEGISPDFGKFFGSDNVGMRALVFYDNGHVKSNNFVNHLSPPAGTEQHIGSIGAGLRYNYGKRVVARFDYASVVDGDITKDNPGGSRRDGDKFGHIGVAFIW
jgi:hemolysin activation/secretion protein